MKPKLVMHTELSGEISLSIFNKNAKLGKISLGTDPKTARKKAAEFVETVRGADGIVDQIT
ncbi:MAG: hypothetical protein LRY76_07515 [Alphaproteobacteria bacterium]|nr:hypothetical protein [Alphaproteobacteria bacterium]